MSGRVSSVRPAHQTSSSVGRSRRRPRVTSASAVARRYSRLRDVSGLHSAGVDSSRTSLSSRRSRGLEREPDPAADSSTIIGTAAALSPLAALVAAARDRFCRGGSRPSRNASWSERLLRRLRRAGRVTRPRTFGKIGRSQDHHLRPRTPGTAGWRPDSERALHGADPLAVAVVRRARSRPDPVCVGPDAIYHTWTPPASPRSGRSLRRQSDRRRHKRKPDVRPERGVRRT